MNKTVELSLIQIDVDSEYGPLIRFTDYNHFDYIDDVFTEIFDIESEHSTHDDDNKKYVIYFGKSCDLNAILKAVKEINHKHAVTEEIYATV